MKKAFSTLILLFTITLLFAQQKTDFSGTYTINKSKIDFGKAPQWVLPIRYKISKTTSRLTVVRTSTDQGGTETDRTLLFGSNNVSEYTAPSGSKIKVTLQWNSDGSTLTLDQMTTTADGKAGTGIHEVFSMADNGKTLIDDRHVEQPDGLKYDIKAYYDKQNQ